jgi:hypothetical protein
VDPISLYEASRSLGLQSKTLSVGLIWPPPATGNRRVAPNFPFYHFDWFWCESVFHNKIRQMWIMENWDDKVKYLFWHCVYFKYRFWAGKLEIGTKENGRVSQRHVKMCWEWRKIDHNDIQNELNFKSCSICCLINFFSICLSVSIGVGGKTIETGQKKNGGSHRVRPEFRMRGPHPTNHSVRGSSSLPSPSEIDFLGFFLKRQQCMDRLFT